MGFWMFEMSLQLNSQRTCLSPYFKNDPSLHPSSIIPFPSFHDLFLSSSLPSGITCAPLIWDPFSQWTRKLSCVPFAHSRKEKIKTTWHAMRVSALLGHRKCAILWYQLYPWTAREDEFTRVWRFNTFPSSQGLVPMRIL